MKYQALARKYRPQSFDQLLGQSHILKPVINALDTNRMHHAYLFTGTRGVGKTSIARIITKALNCEKKISSKPCLKCANCTDIAKGSFVDLIEIDAASKTGVDDMRDILEKVQYKPLKARYKVYLIDEVHMFSKSSFNALLKTLEEPPSHVVFLLATTDAEKIPITVLSRCLKFNLRRISNELIYAQMEQILNQEKVKFDSKALISISEAADGSMRDGLSILDQAIAFGNGEVLTDVLESMLGHISIHQCDDLLLAIAQSDCEKILKLSDSFHQIGLNFHNIFDSLMQSLHQISLVHALGGKNEFIDLTRRESIAKLAQSITIEQAQLFYEIGMRTKADLNNVSNPKLAFDMALLKMALFTPDHFSINFAAKDAPDKPAQKAENPQISQNSQEQKKKSPNKQKQLELEKQETDHHNQSKKQAEIQRLEHLEVYKPMLAVESEKWLEIIKKLTISQFGFDLIVHSVVTDKQEGEIELAIDQLGQDRLDDFNWQDIKKALKNYFAKNEPEFKINLKICQIHCDSPYDLIQKENDAKIKQKIDQLKQSEIYQELENHFPDLKVIKLKPIETNQSKKQG